MKLTLSKEHNVNYIATVVKIKEILPIKGADKIVQVIVDGFSVVVDKSTKVGDIFIFCPIDSRLNPELLKNNNLYDDVKLNKHYLETPNAWESDIEFKRGFFNKKGQVKPITLRKTPSQGFLIKPEMLSFIEGIDIDFSKKVGTRFDTIGDFLLLKKFVVPTKEVVDNVPASKLDSGEKRAIHDLVFHYNTPMLNRNLNHLSLDDELTITIKMHGTSAIFSKRSYKPRTIIDKIKNFFGLYKGDAFISASRTRIRSNDDSIWTRVGDKIKKYLPDNITVYGEIVGYDDYKMIQKGYDYGCEPGECLFMPYRVIKHNEDGTDVEYSMREVVGFSIDLQVAVYDNTLKIMYPYILYRGDVKHLLPDLNNINKDTWRDDLLNSLINRKDWYMEKNEPLCRNRVPREGIVLRLEGHNDKAVYKLKCQKFYERESAELNNE